MGASSATQRGFTLIEGLIALLIFSLGILGLVAMQANAINMSTEARYRADAAFLADQLFGLLSVADPAQLASFAHRSTGGNLCAPGGNDTTAAVVTDWLTQVNGMLPNAPASKQQIVVNAADRTVTVTLCWQAVQGVPHHHTVTSQLQWQ
ncbi:type IV pilus assembly protein PilV [Oryzomicrobium terrae]|uniref:Type IV pilus assembly protein PilV n=1 Tax=Oryzomicrobium terrae TaxID=1735038 RepID=A0A5C1E5J8_9RHOO|nr:type IV pilus modification protein PilV [Oryzomicrobium terrae]QEL64201.1 type IV pilus assembly protein PilV [Oryzomicrobium terrae]